RQNGQSIREDRASERGVSRDDSSGHLGLLAARTFSPTPPPATAWTTPTIAATFTTRALAVATTVRLRLRHAFRPRQERLHRQAQASALVSIDELHLHAVALLHDVLGLLGALVAHLRDVHEAFGARHDLDERAERRRRLHHAFVGLANNRLRGEGLHHLA